MKTKDMTQALDLFQTTMDLARLKHIDLAAAANMVGLVLMGNGRVLKQYGIDIKDTATPLQAMAQLQSFVSGQAEAFSHTMKGQLEVLGAQFTRIEEQLGGIFLPIIERVLAAFISFADRVIPSVQNAWAMMHPYWVQAEDVLKKIYDVLSILLAPAIQIITDNWKALVKQVREFLTQHPEVRQALIWLAEFLAGAVVASIMAVVLAIGYTIAAVVLVVTKVIEAALAIGRAFADMARVIAEQIAIITTTWTGLWQGLGLIFKSIWAIIKAEIKAAIDWINSQISGVLSAINSVRSAASSVGRAVGGAVNAVGNFFTGGDMILRPNGDVVQTDPADYLIATKNPSSLVGAGGIVLNISGNTFLDAQSAEKFGNKLIDILKSNLKI